MKMGLKYIGEGAGREIFSRRARLPDEEGTEIFCNVTPPLVHELAARGSPMKRGLKFSDRNTLCELFSAARGSPMKRGLKSAGVLDHALSGLRRARLPDEEGTEIRRPRRGN